jgi:nucleoside-diphosphate-sugar epimerase
MFFLVTYFSTHIKKERVKYFHGDVRKYSDVRKATQEVDVVFHIASYGMSGREMLDKQKIYEINVNGSATYLLVCCSYFLHSHFC